MSLTSALEPLRARWAGLPGREKNGIRLAGLLVLALLLWQFSVGPSLATLRTARDYVAFMRESSRGDRLDRIRQALEQLQANA